MRIHIAAAALIAAATPALAQNEAVLRQAFEGKVVTVKIVMPATSQGVDVYPLESMPVNFRDVAERLKDNSTALKMGQQVMVTKVVVKKNSHIEFQLGGGGYGTFGDNTSTNVSHSNQSETKEEKALRDSIKHAPGPTKRKQFEKELASLRGERERENARAEAEAKQAQAMMEANLRAKRAESGSRFNVRYRNGIPSDALTPDGLMRALAQYVDFGQSGGVVSSGPGSSTIPSSQSVSPGSARGGAAPTSIRKGLLLEEVESILGPAATASETKEGTLTVLKRTYRKDGQKISASFVNGVLIDFAITPQ
jgi:hypothetical protein